MYLNNKLIIGKNDKKETFIIPKMANRHGIITGASGSGKTTSVKVLAESFSKAGIPVFFIDVKGDLAGTFKSGEMNENVQNRINKLGLNDFNLQGFPVTFFDVFGKNGHPIRTTIENIGSRLLSRMLELSEVQEGVLAIIFEIAKDKEMKLNDLKDLEDIVDFVGDNKEEFQDYGNITTQTIGTIKRNLLELRQQGGDYFFGKPDLQLYDLLQFDFNGQGFINILDAQELFKKPTLYAVFLIWILNNLFDNMPEVGDLDRPKMILFLDEAHLIFSEMSPSLIKQITQVVKLIRSKGIGVYFISQSPADIPDEILSQLSNKIQHVLRSYTPNDEKAVRAACNSFRANPEFKMDEAIKSLATGEAIVSFLNENGEPNIAERVMILPPQSYMGTISDSERDSVVKGSRIYGKYEQINDELSASEKVKEERQQKEEEQIKMEEEKKRQKEEQEAQKQKEKEEKEAQKLKEKKEKEEAKEAEKRKKALLKPVKQIGNKVVNKATTKVVSSIWKKIFK